MTERAEFAINQVMGQAEEKKTGWGGKRKGAGRPRGAFGKKRRILEGIRADMEKSDLDIIDPVKFMLAVTNCDDVDLATRVDCAGKAAPYVRSRLNTIKHEAEQGDLFVELISYSETQVEQDTPSEP